jgi:hypothetical protein
MVLVHDDELVTRWNSNHCQPHCSKIGPTTTGSGSPSVIARTFLSYNIVLSIFLYLLFFFLTRSTSESFVPPTTATLCCERDIAHWQFGSGTQYISCDLDTGRHQFVPATASWRQTFRVDFSSGLLSAMAGVKVSHSLDLNIYLD